MIAAGHLTEAFRGAGGKSFDVPVAALAGLSVAFFAFAAPADLLADLVGATGLPSLLAAAEPPLGMKARLSVGAAGAIAVFAVAFLLLRWLDGWRPGASFRAVEAPDEVEMPRLRRRDFHPDAPPRPPLLASSDLGEPEAFASARRSWLPEEPVEDEPVAAPEAEEIEPAPAVSPPPPTPSLSTAELMERLEQGLARRRVSPAPQPPAAPKVFPQASDDRLQSAIDNLQRLATRQD